MVNRLKQPTSRPRTGRIRHCGRHSEACPSALTDLNLREMVEANGRNFDLRAEGNVLLLEHPDRPA